MPSAKSLSRNSYRTYPAISKIKSTTFKSRSSCKNVIVGDVGIPRGVHPHSVLYLCLAPQTLAALGIVFYLCLILLLRLGHLLTARRT